MGKSLMKTYIDKEKPWGFVIVLVKENRFVWCWSSPICNSPYYIIIFTAGHGTNNQAEFSALQLLLKTDLDKTINHLQVMEGPNITIVWANQHSNLKNSNTALVPILNQV